MGENTPFTFQTPREEPVTIPKRDKDGFNPKVNNPYLNVFPIKTSRCSVVDTNSQCDKSLPRLPN